MGTTPEDRARVIAIDGGGTHSRGCLATGTGRVLREASGGPLNHNTTSVECFRDSLGELLAQLRIANEPDTPPSFIAIGSAAFFDVADDEARRMLLTGLVPLDRTALVGDAVTALHGATGGSPGVLVISGTGSIAAALDGQGRFRCHGGLGPLIESDPGSALWMASRAMRVAQQHLAQQDHLDRLGEEICRALEHDRLNDAILHLYRARDSARQLARVARHLADCDPPLPAWSAIEEAAGVELARMVLPLMDHARCGVPRSQALPIHIGGSVLAQNSRVRASLQKNLASAVDREIALCRPQGDAVTGALHLALRRFAGQGDGGITSTEARS